MPPTLISVPWSKKLVDNNKKAKNLNKEPKFVVAADFLAKDLKKNVKKGTGLSGLHKKLFKGSTGSSAGAKRGEESTKKALTEVRENTRTLAMVLRSERELLSMNKEQEEQIAELKLLVEKLKDLCLKQREEIKCLKSAVVFPDVMNSHLQELVEKQGSELKQAKQLIPGLQRQVTSLTGQLRCLAEDLAEVKAGKYAGRRYCDGLSSSPRAPSYDQEDGANSLVREIFTLFDQEFSSGDYTIPESPDDMFLKDLNPCLTPYYAKTKSKELDGYDSPDDDDELSGSNLESSYDIEFNTCGAKLSKSPDCCQSSTAGNGRGSDENKCMYGINLVLDIKSGEIF
ncbi:UNVERIFIED_CONTAM: hypothetical protein Slati_4033700 [Sesamum latifolium]|uniref:Uncharacterized protein n=1 Tax=Sesamum latifolium TaxID=2727402 RepID=A0AAW2TRN1_9LAMI